MNKTYDHKVMLINEYGTKLIYTDSNKSRYWANENRIRDTITMGETQYQIMPSRKDIDRILYGVKPDDRMKLCEYKAYTKLHLQVRQLVRSIKRSLIIMADAALGQMLKKPETLAVDNITDQELDELELSDFRINKYQFIRSLIGMGIIPENLNFTA